MIKDENGIAYEEVDYKTYLNSKNKHRMIKTLEAQYFVEVKELKELKGFVQELKKELCICEVMRDKKTCLFCEKLKEVFK